MDVSETMTPQPLKVPADATVAEAQSMMEMRGLRHLPVVAKNGRLAGILTDYAVHLGDPEATAESIAAELPSCVEDTPLLEAFRRLDSTTMDALVVVDRDQHPIGILTEHDAVRVAPALLEGTVSEIRRSSRGLISVGPDETWKAAFALMVEHLFRHLPIIEGGEVIGVVSLRNLLAAGVTHGRDGKMRDLVREGPIHTAKEGGRAVTAAKKMAAEKVCCLLLVNSSKQAIGIVTRSDLISIIVATLEADS